MEAIRRAGLAAWILAAASLLLVMPASPVPGGGGAEVLTFHGDLARTGWNAAEPALGPGKVRPATFGRRWSAPVEGDIYAEPLLARGVEVGGSTHTILYAVTEHDLVYAFDAADGKRLWGPVSIGAPVPRSSLPCGNIDPVGITSTPAIDRASSTLYVVGLTTPDGGQSKVYKIAALDLGSGKARPGWPVTISPPAASGLRFDPGIQQQRGALALVRGTVYIPFGGYWGDCGAYHGWVVGVPTSAPGRQEAFATPTRRMGGIWATGGLAADAEGSLYASTGNSDSSGNMDLGESVFRLATSPALAFSGAARDFFVPSNYVALNESDTDLGSAAPLILPPLPSGATPNLLFIAGKQGVAYLINRDDMGGVSKGNGITGEGAFSRCIFGDCGSGRPKVFSATAYWDGGSAGRFIFVPGHGSQPAACQGTGGVVALRLGVAPGSARPILDVAWCSPSMSEAGAPSVSSNGAEGGVVWVVDAGTSILYALDARTGQEVYSSGTRDALGSTHRFVTPAVADGHVYVGAARAVVAFGPR